jgi:hypothetical protein
MIELVMIKDHIVRLAFDILSSLEEKHIFYSNLDLLHVTVLLIFLNKLLLWKLKARLTTYIYYPHVINIYYPHVISKEMLVLVISGQPRYEFKQYLKYYYLFFKSEVLIKLHYLLKFYDFK